MKFGLQIEMLQYLNQKNNNKIIPTGEFLNRLLGIFKISKKRFAEYIELERTNLQAIIKTNKKSRKQNEGIYNNCDDWFGRLSK